MRYRKLIITIPVGYSCGNKEMIEKDLSFIGDKYFSNIELVTYKPINGAIGASARVVYDYFIN